MHNSAAMIYKISLSYVTKVYVTIWTYISRYKIFCSINDSLYKSKLGFKYVHFTYVTHCLLWAGVVPLNHQCVT